MPDDGEDTQADEPVPALDDGDDDIEALIGDEFDDPDQDY